VSADYLLYGRKKSEYIDQISQLLQGKKPEEIEKMIQVMKIMAS